MRKGVRGMGRTASPIPDCLFPTKFQSTLTPLLLINYNSPQSQKAPTAPDRPACSD